MPKTKETLYIAYGSNMNMEQMKRRCRTAKVVSVGTLRNWRLRFYGNKGSAVATIMEADGYSIPVLVWKIKPMDELSLDVYEGFPRLYRKEYIDVEIGGKVYSGMVYIMNERKGFKYTDPSPFYIKTITKGYEDCGLPVADLVAAVMDNNP